jgi:hypothetical protein
MSSTLQRFPSAKTTYFFETVPLNWQGSPLLFTTSALLATAIFLLLAGVTFFTSSKSNVLRQTPFLGSLGFYSARHDFMDATLRNAQNKLREQNKDSQRGGTYAFSIANFKVNVLHGEVGRKVNSALSSLVQPASDILTNSSYLVVLWRQEPESLPRLPFPPRWSQYKRYEFQTINYLTCAQCP